MYSVSRINESLWSVYDDQRPQQPVYVGDLRSVEEWLDFQENLARLQQPVTSRRTSIFVEMWRPLKELVAKIFAKPACRITAVRAFRPDLVHREHAR
jgi:hypothetical protein